MCPVRCINGHGSTYHLVVISIAQNYDITERRASWDDVKSTLTCEASDALGQDIIRSHSWNETYGLGRRGKCLGASSRSASIVRPSASNSWLISLHLLSLGFLTLVVVLSRTRK